MRRAAVRHSAPAADTGSPVPTFRPYFVNLAQKVVEKLFDTSHASRRRPTGSCRCLQRCRASPDSTPSAVRLDRWRRPTQPSGAVRLDTRGRPTRASRPPTHRGRHDTYPVTLSYLIIFKISSCDILLQLDIFTSSKLVEVSF